MGKKTTKNTDLGRALIKDKKNKGRRKNNASQLHTTELADGYDWGRLNLQSVTEESSFQEFLSTAELAGTEFQAEKLNITFIPKNTYLPSKEEVKRIKELQIQLADQIVIPRRPKWNETTTAEELHANERQAFLNWRRDLAYLQEHYDLQLTPYEKNLEFWRQLWRVLDRSDIVVQIVDARNPLLYHSIDLEKYTKELNSSKKTLLLLNKADLLTPNQRKYWADYLESQGIQAAFYSATQQTTTPKKEQDDDLENKIKDSSEEVKSETSESSNEEYHSDFEEDDYDEWTTASESEDTLSNTLKNINIDKANIQVENIEIKPCKNSSELLNKTELISLFRSIQPAISHLTVGLVGYPNVGKSSTINSLMEMKKVSVSSQPGKTKHFQTLFLEKDLVLCDCPGLVMPSFVVTKADMVTSGILPIDHLRDHVPSVALILNLIPRDVLETKYGVMLPLPSEFEDPSRPPTPEEFLNAFAFVRGFMTQNGQPDNARAARYFLRDFVSGKLLHAYAPPGIDQNEYHKHIKPEGKKVPEPSATATRALKSNLMTSQDVDKAFFSGGIHIKGSAQIASSTTNPLKPWKDHKAKRNKREKLRRVYAHLDQ